MLIRRLSILIIQKKKHFACDYNIIKRVLPPKVSSLAVLGIAPTRVPSHKTVSIQMLCGCRTGSFNLPFVSLYPVSKML